MKRILAMLLSVICVLSFTCVSTYIYHTAKLAFCRQLGINIDSRLEGRGAVFASHTRPFPLRHKSTNALQQRHAELLI